MDVRLGQVFPARTPRAPAFSLRAPHDGVATLGACVARRCCRDIDKRSVSHCVLGGGRVRLHAGVVAEVVHTSAGVWRHLFQRVFLHERNVALNAARLIIRWRVCLCERLCARARVLARSPAHLNSRLHVRSHARSHTRLRACSPACAIACMHVCAGPRSHTHTPACAHARAHEFAHSWLAACSFTHTRSHASGKLIRTRENTLDRMLARTAVCSSDRMPACMFAQTHQSLARMQARSFSRLHGHSRARTHARSLAHMLA